MDNADQWFCKTCRVPVSSEANACPFCGRNAYGEVAPTFLVVAAGYVGVALLVCVGWTAFFALLGLVCALATGDWPFMGAMTAFGLVAGVLFGSGSIIIRAVASRREPSDDQPSQASHGTWIGGHILAAVFPILKPLILLISAAAWLLTRDPKRQSPGKSQRALVGALVLGTLGTGLLTLAYFLIGPPPPGGLTLLEAAVAILILGGIGAVLGLLSDAW